MGQFRGDRATDADSCRAASLYWYSDTCNTNPISCSLDAGLKIKDNESCQTITVADAITQTSCTSISKYWYDGSCHEAVKACSAGQKNTTLGDCEALTLSEANNKTDCNAISAYWYSNACNAAAITCSSVYLQPDSVGEACESIAAPSVSSISPTSGSAAGGENVTISGTGFVSGASVSLGGSSCSISSLSATAIVCQTGDSDSTGALNVVVTNGDSQSGRLNGGFTYNPSYSSLSPTSGSSGTSIVVTGNGFSNSTVVKLAGTACSSTTYTSPTSLTCVAPSLPGGAKNIEISNSDGTSTTQSAVFTYSFSNVELYAGKLDPRGLAHNPTGIAKYGSDYYFSNYGSHCVQKIDGSTSAVTLFKGGCGVCRVRGELPPSSHRTVRTGPYTALHVNQAR